MVVFQSSNVWHTAVVFGDWSTQQMLRNPPVRGSIRTVKPPPPQPPQPIRDGWFNKCQRLCHAVLNEDWDRARETADMYYAGPDF